MFFAEKRLSPEKSASPKSAADVFLMLIVISIQKDSLIILHDLVEVKFCYNSVAFSSVSFVYFEQFSTICGHIFSKIMHSQDTENDIK